MVTITPEHLTIPRALDPLFDYFADVLPSPAYTLLITILSHLLALAGSLISLATTMLHSNPLNWDTRTILPPIITALAAYLALVNLYRTTGWFIRMWFRLIKWGVILSCLVGGLGWTVGTFSVGGLSSAALALSDMISGGNNVQPASSRKARERPQFKHSSEKRRERQEVEGDNEAAQKIMRGIMSAAARTMTSGGWMNTIKSVLDSFDDGAVDSEGSQYADGKGKATYSDRNSRTNGNSRSR